MSLKYKYKLGKFFKKYKEPNDIDNLLVYARNTLAVWAPKADDTIPDGMVVLSVSYPKVFVTKILKDAMEKCDKPGSFIFKRIVQSLFANDKKIWADRVGSDMLKDFPSEVSAAFGELIKLKILHKSFLNIYNFLFLIKRIC